MKEPQSFRFRAATRRRWQAALGRWRKAFLHRSILPISFVIPSPARPPPPVLSHAPVSVLTPSFVRRRPRGHLAVSQGVRQLVQHVTTAKADGPPLLSYSPHPPLPSTGDGKGQRKAASAAACQSSSIGRGRRGSVGRRGRAKATAAAGDRDRDGEVGERGGGVVGGSGESPLRIGRTVWPRAGAEGGSIESVEERTAAAAVDGRGRLFSLWPPHLTTVRRTEPSGGGAASEWRRRSGRERGPRKAEQASERSRDEGRLTREEGQAAVRGWFQSESAVAATAGCLIDGLCDEDRDVCHLRSLAGDPDAASLRPHDERGPRPRGSSSSEGEGGGDDRGARQEGRGPRPWMRTPRR